MNYLFDSKPMCHLVPFGRIEALMVFPFSSYGQYSINESILWWMLLTLHVWFWWNCPFLLSWLLKFFAEMVAGMFSHLILASTWLRIHYVEILCSHILFSPQKISLQEFFFLSVRGINLFACLVSDSSAFWSLLRNTCYVE